MFGEETQSASPGCFEIDTSSEPFENLLVGLGATDYTGMVVPTAVVRILILHLRFIQSSMLIGLYDRSLRNRTFLTAFLQL